MAPRSRRLVQARAARNRFSGGNDDHQTTPHSPITSSQDGADAQAAFTVDDLYGELTQEVELSSEEDRSSMVSSAPSSEYGSEDAIPFVSSMNEEELVHGKKLRALFGGADGAVAYRIRRDWARRLKEALASEDSMVSDEHQIQRIEQVLQNTIQPHAEVIALGEEWLTNERVNTESFDSGLGDGLELRLNISDTNLIRVWQHIRRELFERFRVRIQEWVKNAQHDQSLRATKAEEEDLIVQAVRMLYPFAPRTRQVRVLRHLLFGKGDLVWLAKTSAGKSLVFQVYSLLSDATSIVILPLNQIGEEQMERIAGIGGRPLLLTGNTKPDLTTSDWKSIRRGEFTHILLGPEMASQPWFRKLQLEASFRRRLGLVVCDELHLVYQWGVESPFRPEYAMLKVFRTILSRKVKFFGCTATLEPGTLEKCCNAAGFHSEPLVIKDPIDRPEVAMRCTPVPSGMLANYSALFYLLDGVCADGNPDPVVQLPEKAVCFIDTRSGAHDAANAVRQFIKTRWPGLFTTDQIYRMVRTYHGRTRRRTQKRVIQEFRKPDSAIRILFATEALGLGVDLPDVKRIVQFRLPAHTTLRTIQQRAGRAVRDSGKYGGGTFTVLHEAWQIGGREEPDADHGPARLAMQRPGEIPDPTEIDAVVYEDGEGADTVQPFGGRQRPPRRKRNKPLSDEERRMRMNRALHEWVNLSAHSGGCRRATLLSFFAECAERGRMPCCDLCSPDFTLDATRLRMAAAIPVTMPDALPSDAKMVASLKRQILVWESNTVKDIYRDAIFPYLPGTLVHQSAIQAIATEYGIPGSDASSEDRLRRVLKKNGVILEPLILGILLERLRVFLMVAQSEYDNTHRPRVPKPSQSQTKREFPPSWTSGRPTTPEAAMHSSQSVQEMLTQTPTMITEAQAASWDSSPHSSVASSADEAPVSHQSRGSSGKGYKRRPLAEVSTNIAGHSHQTTKRVKRMASMVITPPLRSPETGRLTKSGRKILLPRKLLD